MNDELREAVEAADRACSVYKLGFEGRRHWAVIKQALRDQEAEIARLQNVADANAELYQHELLRTQKAEALLRECISLMDSHSIDLRQLGEKLSLAEKITAHLGGENND